MLYIKQKVLCHFNKLISLSSYLHQSVQSACFATKKSKIAAKLSKSTMLKYLFLVFLIFLITESFVKKKIQNHRKSSNVFSKEICGSADFLGCG